MARLLEWDGLGDHLFETGVDQCVLYVYDETNGYKPGVAWSGVTGINESPSGAQATKMYADNIKYLNLYSAEEFGATIEAYTYPDEWAVCDGSADATDGMRIGQQSRKVFGLCYRTKIGNDTVGEDYGYKLHLVYGCQASVSARQYQTVNDSPSANTFSWEMTTTPVNVGTLGDVAYKPTSIITIDSTKVNATDLATLETKLYGTAATTGANPTEPIPAYLPLPSEVYTILTTTAQG